MSEPMTETVEHNDDVALVGEYALHLLDAEARRAFEHRLAAEPQLRALLRDWDENLIPLADDFTAIPPPPRVKERIDATLFPAQKKSFGTWLRTSFGGGVLVASLLAVLLLAFLPQSDPTVHRPGYHSNVASQDQSLFVRVVLEADSDELVFERQAGDAPTGRSLELWLIAKDAEAPISLGVLPQEPNGTISLSGDLLAIFEDGTIAITDEPLGGSPDGTPTGDVVASGEILLI
ncbi:anti-sigma factor domain-containing protein [Falsihalocynthiibacter sp. SS001]|uniref:anti-sigma factor n=1 Tax=Falsihalocynthiibacter sp. SS001 TaxID=3349698 RepID=UPI0036D326D0